MLNSRTLIPKLRSLPTSASKCKYSMLIRCACRWKWTNQVLELALDWMEHSYQEKQVDDGKVNNYMTFTLLFSLKLSYSKILYRYILNYWLKHNKVVLFSFLAKSK